MKGILKKCIKFTGEHPCRSVISINLLCNFIETAFWHGSFPVNLLYIFSKTFPKITSCRLLLKIKRFKNLVSGFQSLSLFGKKHHFRCLMLFWISLSTISKINWILIIHNLKTVTRFFLLSVNFINY